MENMKSSRYIQERTRRILTETTAPDAPAASACCSSEKQEVCCEPSEKSSCCGPAPSAGPGCGCQ